MPSQQAPVNNKSVIIEDALCREDRESQSSSTSTEKLSTRHGHDHRDKCNQQQPVVTGPKRLRLPFPDADKRMAGKGAAHRSLQW